MYAYALNNPVMYADPNGQFAISLAIAGAIIFTIWMIALIASTIDWTPITTAISDYTTTLWNDVSNWWSSRGGRSVTSPTTSGRSTPWNNTDTVPWDTRLENILFSRSNSGRGAYNDPNISLDPNGNPWDDESIKKAMRQARKSGDFNRFNKLKDFQKRFMNRRHHDVRTIFIPFRLGELA